MINFNAHTINCVFRVLGIYNFGASIIHHKFSRKTNSDFLRFPLSNKLLIKRVFSVYSLLLELIIVYSLKTIWLVKKIMSIWNSFFVRACGEQFLWQFCISILILGVSNLWLQRNQQQGSLSTMMHWNECFYIYIWIHI